MIERYSRKEMSRIWAPETRFTYMLQVEKAVAKVQAKHKIIPAKAAREIEIKGKFSKKRIDEIEKTTKHDVIAFVQSVAESIGPSGVYVHFGLTSSDVLDTALSLALRDAGNELSGTLEELEDVLERLAKKHVTTLTAGRTHGMHAETTSFGVKLAGFLAELRRDQLRLKNAITQASVGKLSGAVGTYTTLSAEIETEVCRRLDLEPETIATQVIPRDRIGEVLSVLALIGGFFERLAVELRHLQRTEVGEVIECFTPGQKGSSAMPHKKNPISAENITGVARLLRGYLLAGLENLALWHERDISHSSVERVILPDAFIICDYAAARLTDLLRHLYVDRERMKRNMDLSQGQLLSSQILSLMVRKGLSRDDAYKLVQQASHSLRAGENLITRMSRDPQVKKLTRVSELQALAKESNYKTRFTELLKRVDRMKSKKVKSRKHIRGSR